MNKASNERIDDDMEYLAGMGCTCAAISETECGCDVDWTDPRIYKLEQEIAMLRAAILETLEEQGHLADGDNCTLIKLKRAIDT